MSHLLRHTWIKITFIILGLTILFVFDDFLLLLLIGQLRIWDISLWVYLFLTLLVLLLNGSLALVVYRAMKRKPTTGQEGMIGRTGVAIEDIQNTGRVSVQGEIWQAESRDKIKKGEKVKVVALSRLTVTVVKWK